MSKSIFALSLIGIVIVSSCGPGSDKHASQQSTSSSSASSFSDRADDDADSNQSDNSGQTSPNTEDAAREKAIEELDDQTYEDVMGSSECTEDCSGHDAGWEWAKKSEILDENDCSGNSQSFIEGCQAYANEVERRTTENENDPN